MVLYYLSAINICWQVCYDWDIISLCRSAIFLVTAQAAINAFFHSACWKSMAKCTVDFVKAICYLSTISLKRIVQLQGFKDEHVDAAYSFLLCRYFLLVMEKTPWTLRIWDGKFWTWFIVKFTDGKFRQLPKRVWLATCQSLLFWLHYCFRLVNICTWCRMGTRPLYWPHLKDLPPSRRCSWTVGRTSITRIR